jgi:hypothetical protein
MRGVLDVRVRETRNVVSKMLSAVSKAYLFRSTTLEAISKSFTSERSCQGATVPQLADSATWTARTLRDRLAPELAAPQRRGRPTILR